MLPVLLAEHCTEAAGSDGWAAPTRCINVSSLVKVDACLRLNFSAFQLFHFSNFKSRLTS